MSSAFPPSQGAGAGTLADVLSFGNTTGGFDISMGAGDQLLIDPGTVGAPGLAWVGELDTGLYQAVGTRTSFSHVGVGTLHSTPNALSNASVDLNRTVGLGVDSDGTIGWTATAGVPENPRDTTFSRLALGSIAQTASGNGAAVNRHYATELLAALAGASVVTSGLVPAGSVLIGISLRVTVAVTGATSFNVGDGADVDRWGLNIAIAVDTTADMGDVTAGAVPGGFSTAAQEVTLTAVGPNFTGGSVRVVAWYEDLTAPTS